MAMSEPRPSAVAVGQDMPRLGCGRSADEVWDHIDAEPDDHERDCEYCTRAREQLQRLASVAGQAREEEASESSPRPGAALTGEIMRLARTEIRRGRLLPLERVETVRPDAALAISDIAVMAVVRRAADTVPGVRARRCSVTSSADPATAVGSGVEMSGAETSGTSGSGQETVTMAVDLQVATAIGASIPELTERLRRVVIDAVSAHVGLELSRIDITVGDLYDA